MSKFLSDTPPIHILFIIRSLDTGGAERQLIELVRGIDKDVFTITVMTFYDGGLLCHELENFKEVKLTSLHKQSRWDIFLFLKRFWQVVYTSQPDIIYSFLPTSNVMALLVGKAFRKKVVWGIRSSNMDLDQYKGNSLAKIISFTQKILSKIPDIIIINSFAGKEYHIQCGYSEKRMLVIPNGIDTHKFQPDQFSRINQRSKWNIREDEYLVGIVARLDPMKGHNIFFETVALLSKQNPKIRFVCVGDGPEEHREILQNKAKFLEIVSFLIWAGNSQNMPMIYNALDVLVSSSSYGEGFSNVIGEAMACGVPCVVTDVGDSARIVGQFGKSVCPQRPDLLANAIAQLIEQIDTIDHKQIRRRVIQHFNLDLMIKKTEEALLDVINV